LLGENVTDVLDDSEVKRALAVMAHPDDIDFSSAGTIAAWTDQGIEVTYVMVTNGDAGGFDPAVPRADIPGIRQAEQRAAAKAVGVEDVRFLGYPDGMVEATLGLRRDIARVIRQVRPDRVVLPSPERNYDRVYAGHPDHRAVGAAAMDAVYPDARNPFTFPELVQEEELEAWTVREVWIPGGKPEANHHVDVTAVFDRKVAALRSHVSQVEHHPDLEGMLRGWMTANAQSRGLPEGVLAEIYRVINTA
jgi:LmbE family N-acetylglucosaminyl deacetylase